MIRSTKLLPVLSAIALAACASSGAPDPAPMPGSGAAARATPAVVPVAEAAPSGASGASFTADQANRGRDAFRGMCTECHYSSEFSDSQFKFKWSRRTAGSLYDFIFTQMPETAPGSLSPQEAVDLVSYVLRMNGFEPGATELTADHEALDRISLAPIR